jgi:hypothetical protein
VHLTNALHEAEQSGHFDDLAADWVDAIEFSCGASVHRPRPQPSLFIVGAPKTGTTAMNTYLARHPEIFMAPKELHYFSHEAFYGPPLGERDLDWYLDQFREAGEKTVLGEASVWYLSSSTAAQRIKEFEPRAKILIHVRNPADLIVSYHSELLFHGYEDIEDLEQALDAEKQRLEGRNIPVQCVVPRVLYYSEVVRFTEQIERFFTLFGRENVLVNIFDDLVADPAALYRRTLAFLGVDSSFTTTFKVINNNKIVRSHLLRAFMGCRSLNQAARLILSKSRRKRIRKWLWEINTRVVPRPEPTPAVMTRLRREFAGEVERLGDLLGRDLAAWSR